MRRNTLAPTRRSLILGAAAAALVAPAAQAGLFSRKFDSLYYTDRNGTALGGTDPVAYFTEGRPVEGAPEHAIDWAGVTWHFASAANRDLFEADPLAHAPQYGGYCAWAIAAKNELFSTDRNAWRIVDGRLYLNYDANVQATWVKDIPGYIAGGDRNWPGIRKSLV